jgi:hypothetical protein
MLSPSSRAIQQRRIRYTIRGPEWAFAVPQGDLAALDDVMRFAVSFWNGVNSLIVPVDRRGRMPTEIIKHLLWVRPAEQLLVHPRVDDRLHGSLTKLGVPLGRMDARVLKRELGPLTLITEPVAVSEAIADLHLGQANERLARVQRAAWGEIPDEERRTWNRLYRIPDVQENPNPLAGLAFSQIAGRSPLAATTRHMRTSEHGGASYERYLWIFDRASFNDILDFWNCRARLASWYADAVMVGLPREALQDTEAIDLVAAWATTSRGSWSKPELVVCARGKDHGSVRDALTARGFVETSGMSISHGFPAPHPERRDPEFELTGPLFGGPLRRGLISAVEASFVDGESRIAFLAPEGLDGGGPQKVVHIDIDDLPFDLPLNDRLAQAVQPVANAYDGRMSFAVGSWTPTWSFDFKIPSGWDALALWAEGWGFKVRPSQAGRYGQALLGRLSDLQSLDALATEEAVTVLDQLASLSTKKLARELVASVPDVAQIDEALLVDLLTATPLWMELRARTLGEIASGSGRRKKDLAPAVAGLVKRGLVSRGRALRCPVCNYAQWHGIAELDERLRCQACRADFALPVIDGDGSEPATSYRLDGLMARCMDQDLLGVLLTLRWLSHERTGAPLQHSWPGLLFRRGDEEQEVDLLAANSQKVFMVEHKRTASALNVDEAHKLIQLARQFKAVPVLAALTGSVEPEIRELCEEASGLIAEHKDLVKEA